MTYTFYATGTAYYKGTVEADSKDEALEMIKNKDYDEIEMTDDNIDVNSVNEWDLEEEEDIF